MMIHGRLTLDSTSASGPMVGFHGFEAVRLLGGPGTSGLGAMTTGGVAGTSRRAVESTAAFAVAPPSTPSAIGELRRLSGLTWDQLAGLFDANRRSLHFWASGKPMNAGNQERLHRLLGVLRRIDRGSAAANRVALLDGGESGDLPLDLLARGDFERVVELLGTGPGRRPAGPRPSPEEIARRAPRPPAELVGALHDRVHPASGRRLSLDDLRKARKG